MDLWGGYREIEGGQKGFGVTGRILESHWEIWGAQPEPRYKQYFGIGGVGFCSSGGVCGDSGVLRAPP